MTINLGILGFAHGHVNAYCHQWSANPALGIRVIAGWDHDPVRLAAAAQTHNLTPCDSAPDLLRQNIHAVLIAAETAHHADLVELAARARKPIILQKPLALTLDQADRIIAAVDHAAVPFTLAWQMRVDPQNIRIRELVHSGALGRIFMARRRHGLSIHTSPDMLKSWHLNPAMNRDIWADDSSHPFDFIYWLFGMPQTITAELATLFSPDTPNDNGIAVLRYKNGPIAEIVCSFTAVVGENTTEIIGENGVIIQNYGDLPSANAPRPDNAIGLKWYLKETGQWTDSHIPSPASQGERIAALAAPLAAFLHGGPPIATAREARDILKLVLASYDSSERGTRITL